jgi:two-component system osmolarity sensor histidine kinase EnvZ
MNRRTLRRLRLYIKTRWPRRHDLLPKSLFGRSFLIIVAPMVILQLLLVFLFYERHWESVTLRLADALANEVQLVTVLLDNNPNRDYIPRKIRDLSAVMEIELSLQDGGIEVTQRPPSRRIEKLLVEALHENLLYPLNVQLTDGRILIWLPWGNRILLLQASQKRLLSATTYIFILWMLGTAVLVVTIAVLFMRNQVRPLKKLAKLADDVGRGNLTGGNLAASTLDADDADHYPAPPFHPSGALEVRQVAIAFNRMHDRLRRQMVGRLEMLRNVSHDLRTPLTRMRLMIAQVHDQPLQQDLRQEIREMNQMIEGYLAFVRGEADEALEQVELTNWLQDLVPLLAQSDRFPKDGLQLRLPKKPLTAAIRVQAVRRVLANLIDNSMRYSQQICVSLQAKQEEFWLVVEDDGPGIPPQQRDSVFQPFKRLEGSRNPATGGYGLGLTIALDLVRQHGGNMVLGDAVLGGLKVVVKLPR